MKDESSALRFVCRVLSVSNKNICFCCLIIFFLLMKNGWVYSYNIKIQPSAYRLVFYFIFLLSFKNVFSFQKYNTFWAFLFSLWQLDICDLFFFNILSFLIIFFLLMKKEWIYNYNIKIQPSAYRLIFCCWLQGLVHFLAGVLNYVVFNMVLCQLCLKQLSYLIVLGFYLFEIRS
jgi:hypothetical protein